MLEGGLGGGGEGQEDVVCFALFSSFVIVYHVVMVIGLWLLLLSLAHAREIAQVTLARVHPISLGGKTTGCFRVSTTLLLT